MTNAEKLQMAERLEENAHRLLDDAATLREEVSGGSDTSNLQVLSDAHVEQLKQRRRRIRLKH